MVPRFPTKEITCPVPRVTSAHNITPSPEVKTRAKEEGWSKPPPGMEAQLTGLLRQTPVPTTPAVIAHAAALLDSLDALLVKEGLITLAPFDGAKGDDSAITDITVGLDSGAPCPAASMAASGPSIPHSDGVTGVEVEAAVQLHDARGDPFVRHGPALELDRDISEVAHFVEHPCDAVISTAKSPK